MNSFVVFALLIAAAVAAPANPADGAAQILSYESDNIGINGFNYKVETSNGIQQAEEGQLKNIGTENEALEVRGQFSYPGDDGVIYTVTYVANENGFQPSAAHLPQSP